MEKRSERALVFPPHRESLILALCLIRTLCLVRRQAQFCLVAFPLIVAARRRFLAGTRPDASYLCKFFLLAAPPLTASKNASTSPLRTYDMRSSFSFASSL